MMIPLKYYHLYNSVCNIFNFCFSIFYGIIFSVYAGNRTLGNSRVLHCQLIRGHRWIQCLYVDVKLMLITYYCDCSEADIQEEVRAD